MRKARGEQTLFALPPTPDIARCDCYGRSCQYALDVQHLEVQGNLSGENMTAAHAGHVLADASRIGTHTLNPNLRCH